MVVHTYKTNLKCGNCVAAVKPHLDRDPAIRRWSVDTSSPDKVLTVEGTDISRPQIEQSLNAAGFRVLGEVSTSVSPENAKKSFLATYRPLLLVLAYVLGLTAIVEVAAGGFEWTRAMRVFMGGFFVAFSFFKMLDLQGFAASFQTYDLAAKKFRSYAFAYSFVELGLGAAYLLHVWPVATNLVTLAVMLLGLLGVSQALWNKRQIKCACLGTVFNLPMSKVTFVEDALMAAMAAAMLAAMLWPPA